MSKSFKIDYQREQRIGFQEVVFGASKNIDQLQEIVSDFQKNGKSALITRTQKEKATVLVEQFDPSFYDEVSEMLLIGEFASLGDVIFDVQPEEVQQLGDAQILE